MASGMVSRWPVLVTSTLDAGDCDGDRRLTALAVEQLFGEGRAAYFDRCSTVGDTAPEATITSVRQHGSAAHDMSVTVAVGVVEIFAERFTMAARILSAETGDFDVDATCSVTVDSVTPAMRDEFIALAHSAAYIS